MKELLSLIASNEPVPFSEKTNLVEKLVFSFKKPQLLKAVKRIGIIPEGIERDSSEEKLYSKASDFVLARALNYLGLDAEVSVRRGDSADVVATSRFFGYALVADAKAFRLSRTAKNQKDFKLRALNDWKDNVKASFAVLVAPFFHYPQKESQVFRQAIESNVCLLSWEFLYLLIDNELKESRELNLSSIWNYSGELSKTTVVSDSKRSFLDEFASFLTSLLKAPEGKWKRTVSAFYKEYVKLGSEDVDYLYSKIAQIKGMSREDAITKLIEQSGYLANIEAITTFINRLEKRFV